MGIKIQDTKKRKITNRDHSPFWVSFTWKFAESTSNNLDTVLDFTNIIETSGTNNITREVGITGALKFENCKFENYNFNVTVGKEE
jgi:hypothetical protein